MPNSPCIYCVGLNHTSAPLALRERLVTQEDQCYAALTRSGGAAAAHVGEAVIVSTCNRFELYVFSNRPIVADLQRLLGELSGLGPGDLQQHVYHFCGLDAARHLYEVSAGLDSQIVGEPQILGQIRRALQRARAIGTAGPVLNHLFQSTIHAGKRARSETAIGRSHTSVASLAASLGTAALTDLEAARVIILGAGEMAELALESMHRRGARNITVINRSLARAQELAGKWHVKSATLDSLEQALQPAQVVIASTRAPHYLIRADMLRATEQSQPLLLIDIALPRNIDPDCGKMPRVKLVDLERLAGSVEQSLAQRLAEIPRVRIILDEELAQFQKYLDSLEMLPLIAEIYQQAESVRRKELEKALRHLAPLNKDERLRIEALTQALVSKLLGNPARRLREAAGSGQTAEYAEVARSLFGLTTGSSTPRGEDDDVR